MKGWNKVSCLQYRHSVDWTFGYGSFSWKFPFPSKSLGKDGHFLSHSTSSLSRAKIQLCKQQQFSGDSATRLTVSFCSSLPSFHATLVFHLALSLESFRQSFFLCCVFAHLTQTGKTRIMTDTLILLNNNSLHTHTQTPTNTKLEICWHLSCTWHPQPPYAITSCVLMRFDPIGLRRGYLALGKSNLRMSQLPKDLLSVLYELFSCLWQWRHHVPAASETRHGGVKHRYILGAKCNGLAAVRWDFPAIQGSGESVSVCDVCMYYIRFWVNYKYIHAHILHP